MDVTRVEESDQRRKGRRLNDDVEMNVQAAGAASSSVAAASALAGSSSSAAAAPAAEAVPAHAVPIPVDMDLERDAMEIHTLLFSLGMGGAHAADVMEVFCPERLVPYVSLFGLVHGGALT